MTKITHESLLNEGFSYCIFAPIYLTQYSYYLGNIDWSKGASVEIIRPKWYRFWERPKKRNYTDCSKINWGDAKILIAISSDGVSYIDYWTNRRFFTIEEIKEYCKNEGIEMSASKMFKS